MEMTVKKAESKLDLTQGQCQYINRCLVASIQLHNLSAEYISKVKRMLSKGGKYKFTVKHDTDNFLAYMNRMNRDIFKEMTLKEQQDMGDDGEELEKYIEATNKENKED